MVINSVTVIVMGRDPFDYYVLKKHICHYEKNINNPPKYASKLPTCTIIKYSISVLSVHGERG
jgi:hypothetical protein